MYSNNYVKIFVEGRYLHVDSDTKSARQKIHQILDQKIPEIFAKNSKWETGWFDSTSIVGMVFGAKGKENVNGSARKLKKRNGATMSQLKSALSGQSEFEFKSNTIGGVGVVYTFSDSLVLEDQVNMLNDLQKWSSAAAQ